MKTKTIAIILTSHILSLFQVNAKDLIVSENENQYHCKTTSIDSLSTYFSVENHGRQHHSFPMRNETFEYFENYVLESSIQHKLDSLQIEKDSLNTTISCKVLDSHRSYWGFFSLKQGKNAWGFGAEMYSFLAKPESKWIFPKKYGIEIMKFDPYLLYNTPYKMVKIRYGMLGLSSFRKLGNHLYLNLDCQFIIGHEKKMPKYPFNEVDKNMFIGLSTSQGIFLVPKSKRGFSIGLCIYQRRLTSSIYKKDIGVKVDIGLIQ